MKNTGPSRLTPIERAILEWVSLDYESALTIEQNVSEDIGQKVTCSEIEEALTDLEGQGLVAQYRYHETRQVFEKCQGETFQNLSSWWYITAKGRHVVAGLVDL